MTRTRLEGFSDGVFAVAITLLSLGLVVPRVDHTHTLAHELLSDWPHYAAYGVSFLQIGIIWINHHVAVKRLVRPDHAILVCNVFLLMSVGAIPFATDLMASYLTKGAGADTAMAVYCGVLAWMGISFIFLNYFMLVRRKNLLDPTLAEFSARYVLLTSGAGVVPYLAGIGIAFVNPYASLIITFLMAVYYAFPIAVGNLT